MIAFPTTSYPSLSTPGLQIVCDELGKSGGIGVSEHRETLLDVQTACRIAVEILNDLLCFDKLESGILELHKHEVPVNSFISDCVNMFGSQAREAGVTIINNSLMKTDPGASNVWLDTDTVLMDKFKMDQVLRNLISNALKFTTRGGCVSVCASFIPDGTSLYLSSMANLVEKPPSVRNILHKLLNGFKIADSSMYDMESAVPNKDKGREKEQNERRNPKSYVTKSNRGGGAVARVSSVVNDTSHNINNRTTTDASHLSSKIQSTVSKVTSGRLRIVVTDTGAGISQENLVLLFKEIVQFNPEVLQAGGGSGLGLYITSSIVQMHGGTICAYSAGAGSGSTFTVDIDMQLRRLLSPASPLSRKLCNTELAPVQDDSFPERGADDPRQGVSEGHEMLVSEGADTLRSQSYTLQPRRFSDNGSIVALSNTRHPPLSNTCSPTVATTRQSSLVTLGSTISITQLVDVTRKQEYSTMPAPAPAPPPPVRSATPPSAAADTQAGAEAEGENESEGGVVYDILVVDDSSLNRKMLCRLLRTAGYISEEANDGQSAVEKVKARMESGAGTGSKGYYDAILMDFVMPIMDGPTATQAIRGLGYSYPILGVTGNALDSDINYFVKCGANSVLAKPFDFNRFKRLMKDEKHYASV
jgi:signal transduction histidine kinase/ActR/RegA family two-component response regulator